MYLIYGRKVFNYRDKKIQLGLIWDHMGCVHNNKYSMNVSGTD